MDRPVDCDVDIMPNTFTIHLKTPSGKESYCLPISQLSALRTYLKILTCMNAKSTVVTPVESKKRSCS